MTTVERRTFLKAAAGGALMAGPFSGLVAGEALAAPSAAPHRGRGRCPTCATARSGCGCRRASSTGRSTTPRRPVTLDDGTAAARPPRRHGAPSRGRDGNVVLVRNHEVNGPGAGVRPGRRPYDPMAARRHDHRRGHPVRRGRAGVHQPQRHPDELLRRPDAVGQLGHLRGDGQRPGRRARLHRRAPTSPLTQAARLHLRGARPAASPTGEPITAAGRFAHEAVAFDPRDGAPLPDRGQLRLPVGLLPLHARARTRCAPAASTTAAGCRCSRSTGQPNADLAASQPRGRDVPACEWVDIDDPAPDVPVHAGRRPRRPPTTRRSSTSATQGRAQGAAYFSRLEGAVYDDGVIYFTLDPGRRRGGDRARAASPTATATAAARSGRTTPAAERAARWSTSRPGPDTLDFPDNVTTSPRGTLVALRGQHQRQLPARR